MMQLEDCGSGPLRDKWLWVLEDWDDEIVGIEGLSSLEITRLRMSQVTQDMKKLEVM
jgi:hypothetical protein